MESHAVSDRGTSVASNCMREQLAARAEPIYYHIREGNAAILHASIGCVLMAVFFWGLRSRGNRA